MSRLFQKRGIREKNIIIDGQAFHVTVYILPQRLVEYKEINARDVANTFDISGCIRDLTPDFIEELILDGTYKAVIIVKNVTEGSTWEDGAFATLQYAIHCDESCDNKLWVNDLCRISRMRNTNTTMPRPNISPVSVLFGIVDEIANSVKVTNTYLMVDDSEKESAEKLKIHYREKYNYVIDTTCTVKGYTIMKHRVG